MKKKMFKSFLVMAAVALLAAPAFAAGTNDAWNDGATTTGIMIPDTTGGAGGISSLKFSTGVYYMYVANSGTAFGLGTWNSKGTKVYGTNSASSKLYIYKGSDITLSASLPAKAKFQTDVEMSSSDWIEVGK